MVQIKKKKKRTQDDEVDRLQQEVRELKSLNRSLLKRLKKVDRFYHESLEQEEAVVEAKPVYTTPPKCPKCGIGKMLAVTVVGRSFTRCEDCGHRTKAGLV